MEPPDQTGHHPKHQPVDNQKKEPQGENGKGKGEQNEDGPDNGIDDPQEESRGQC